MTTLPATTADLPAVAHRRPRENFPVLSLVVPRELRPAFAAVYTFCRVSDDLADDPNAAPPERLAAIGAWRTQLDLCFQGRPELPAFGRLLPVVRRHDLPPDPFHRLLDAFEEDQRTPVHSTWDEIVRYARRSANPVGELVLRIGGHSPADADWEELRGHSDATCTALQFFNFWQDARRDLLELGRVYMPTDETRLDQASMRELAARPPSAEVLADFAARLKPLVDRTDMMMASATALPGLVNPGIARSVWLFQQGGRSVCRRIRDGGYATLWRRPGVPRVSLALLVVRSMLATPGGRA